MKYNVAVVGATGMVGRKFIEVLEERQFPVDEIYFFASKRSAGKVLKFIGEDVVVEELKEDNIKDKNFDDFKDTTYEEAAAIAYTKYYRAINAFILPLEARLMYFDTAYNMGNSRAIKIMQRCAGVPDDGIIGPATREKMQYVTEECLYNARNTFYNNLVKKNRTLTKFLKGWLNRTAAIKKY